MTQTPTFEDVLLAQQRIAPLVHRTPVMTSEGMDRLAGAELFFKCENLQRVGAFKMRGAANAVVALLEGATSEHTRANGVATHSSGNHAQALACAARSKGAKAYVVMPTDAPRVKRDAVRGYGASVIDCAPGQQAREAKLAEVLAQTGAHYVPPFDDPWVIAGQGTAALEFLEDVRKLDVLLTPLGGGGLLSGTLIAAAARSPETKVMGVEPAQADDAYRSLLEGRIVPSDAPDTIADGLRTSLGELTFTVIRQHQAQVLRVSEGAIVRAMRLVWERMKLLVEPSAAVPVAAALEPDNAFDGMRVGVILSGGNVDLDKLPWLGGELAK